MCSNLKSNQSETSHLRIFMDGIVDKFKIPKDSSFYFPQVAYLKLDLIEEIFVRLKNSSSLFMNNSQSTIGYFPIKVKIEKKHQVSKSKGLTYASQGTMPHSIL